MNKKLQNNDEIVKSILSLKIELERRQAYDLTAREILFKINSCLYSVYRPFKEDL